MRSRTGIRPSFKSSTRLSNRAYRTIFKDVKNEDLKSKTSITENDFSLDAESAGLKSTQELPIDYSRFENHTFFNSARSKVDISFDKIINYFPFDKTRAEIQNFLNLLTGFEKFVFDSFPKNKGYLKFSGSAGNDGSYIKVFDAKSYNFPSLNKTDYGVQVLDPLTSPFDIEVFVNVPEQINDNQVIAQRLSSNGAMTLALSSSTDTSKCHLVFLVSSASDSYLVASGTMSKGDWVHVAAQVEEENGAKKTSIYMADMRLGWFLFIHLRATTPLTVSWMSLAGSGISNHKLIP